MVAGPDSTCAPRAGSYWLCSAQQWMRPSCTPFFARVLRKLMKLTAGVGYTSWCAQMAEKATMLRFLPSPYSFLNCSRGPSLTPSGHSTLPSGDCQIATFLVVRT